MTETNYYKVWGDLKEAAVVKHNVGDPSPYNVYRSNLRSALTEALGQFLFECFCGHVSKTHGTPWQPLENRKAAEWYLLNKYHWLPGVVSDLTEEQLVFSLHQELHEFKLPDRALDACYSDFEPERLTDLIDPHVQRDGQ